MSGERGARGAKGNLILRDVEEREERPPSPIHHIILNARRGDRRHTRHSIMPMPINPLARAGGVDYPAAHVTRHRSCEAWCDSESCMHAGCFDCGPDLRPELGCPAKAPPAPHEELRSAHVKALESISQLTKENVRALQRVEQLTKANDTLQQQLDGRLVPSGVQSLLELKDAAEADALAALRREADEARAALKGENAAHDAEVRELKAARDRQQRLAEEARAAPRCAR